MSGIKRPGTTPGSGAGAPGSARIIVPGDSDATIARKQAQKSSTGEPFRTSTTPNDTRLRQLGINPLEKVGPANLGKSSIIDVLGKTGFAEFQAVREPGRVAWVNFDLARQMGFDVPASNKMTPEFEEKLLEALSFRALGKGEDAGDREVVKMFADRYGGTGLGGNHGAGRAGFLPWGNLNIKGAGVTPLSIPSPHDFLHSHGGAPMREGMVEAVWGEVNANLFTEGSTQILAVIDNNDYTRFPDGGQERRALIVRAGTQFRPAHMLSGYSGGVKKAGEMFVRATAGTGQLVTNPDKQGNAIPDIGATMRNVLDAHAKTSAEQVRWRVLHGAISTSNMELDGAQLDLATSTTQARTARVNVISHGGTFGSEHTERAEELTSMYGVVRDSFNRKDRKAFNAGAININRELTQCYNHHLGVQFMKAAGLKDPVADAVAQKYPTLTEDYRKTLVELAQLSNGTGRFNVDKETHADKSVVDIFNMLGKLPSTYFEDPSADLSGKMRELLEPLYTSGQASANKNKVEQLTNTLSGQYKAMMTAALELGGEFYDDDAGAQRSIVQRAAFENVKMDRMYKSELHWMLIETINGYEANGDPAVFKEAVDKTIAASVRNVDALIGQGAARKIGGDMIELGARTIDGVDYAVHAQPGGKRRLHVEIPLDGHDGGMNLRTLPGEPHLTDAQADALEYSFTTDGWATTQIVGAKRGTDEDGQPVLTFDIPVLKSDVGQLEGLFHCNADGGFWLKDGASNFRGYTFAVPDDHELAETASRLD